MDDVLLILRIHIVEYCSSNKRNVNSMPLKKICRLTPGNNYQLISVIEPFLHQQAAWEWIIQFNNKSISGSNTNGVHHDGDSCESPT